MIIEDLQHKKVCIVGFGKEGQSMLRAIHQHAPKCIVGIADGNPDLDTSNLQTAFLHTGDEYLSSLHQYDVIIKSPGIPPLEAFDPYKDKITNSTQIFLDTTNAKNSKIIGVTGSKGKSTVSSLIYSILREDNRDVHLVGNIGVPAIDYLDTAKNDTIFVLEMSSYQLLQCTTSPQIAVVTSFFPDHLDYHAKEEVVRNIQNSADKFTASIEAYKNAKKHITAFQTESDFVFYDATSQGALDIAQASSGTLVAVSVEDSCIEIESTKLIGEHNIRNIALASTVAKHLDVEDSICKKAVSQFSGLPHRLESLGVHKDIHWIDDAISTTTDSTIAAINSLHENVETIIVGGQDRGINFEDLGKRIAKSSIANVITFPDSGTRIKNAIKSYTDTVSFHEVQTMQEAVDTALKVHNSERKEAICLLSTASPSYNMFKNFEEKGDEFKKCIFEGQ